MDDEANKTSEINELEQGMAEFLTSLFSTNDEQLMWRVKMSDDPEAFARLMSRWEKPIQSLCSRMTGDVHRAEDLTQTAFTRVFARRTDWEPAGKFSTFLWRIALNLCHDEARRRERRGEFSLEALEDTEGGGGMEFAAEEAAPDSRAESQERGELVRRALDELPDHYREVLVMSYFHQFAYKEMADMLHIPLGTVKSRLHAALAAFAKAFKARQEKE